MGEFQYIALREKSDLMVPAAKWFNSKWGVPTEAYLECMEAYLKGETELGWFLCLDGDQIVGGLGVIENDFHDRKDLTPNVCAVYTEESHRGRGIAGKLLDMAVETVKALQPFKEVCVTRAGCTVSSHCGPDTIGVLYIHK